MKKNSIYIFDFDNTLVIPDAQIKISHKDGNVSYVHSSDYEKYIRKPGDIIDFSDFENNTNYREIDEVTNKLIELTIKGHETLILSARNSPVAIYHFTEKHNITKCAVSAIGVPANQNAGVYKAGYIKYLLNKNFNINYVEFYDDRHDCVQEISKLKHQFPGCTFKVYQALEHKYLLEIVQ